MAKPKKWFSTPPTVCDICERELAGLTCFYDAKSQSGPWAIMCHSCWQAQGRPLGTGLGQKYSMKKPYLKIGG